MTTKPTTFWGRLACLLSTRNAQAQAAQVKTFGDFCWACVVCFLETSGYIQGLMILITLAALGAAAQYLWGWLT